MEKEELRVVLLNPRFKEIAVCLPIGLAYLSSYAKKEGFSNISAIDANALGMGFVDVANEAISLKPALVGVSASTITVNEAWDILRKIKEQDNSILTVLGGVHPTNLPEESLNKEFVDFVVRGEGEETFADLLKAAIGKKELEEIEGLSFKRNGSIIHNGPRELIKDLDALPFPDRGIFPFPDKYISPLMKKKHLATILTSRGCPGSCIFCNKSIFDFKFRPRSPEDVVQEIEYLYGQNIREFHFLDDCFSWDISRAEAICDEIMKRNLKISWAATTGIRIDKITANLLKKMRQSGCYRLAFGVESGSPGIIEKIKKGINLEALNSVLNLARKEGLLTTVFFIIGNYGDDLSTIKQTIKFARGLNTDFAQFTMITPFPGTPFYEIVKKEGRFLTQDWSKYGVYNQPVFEMGDLTAPMLKEMYAKAYREFYWRPGKLLRISFHLMRHANFNVIIQMLKNFCEVLRRSISFERSKRVSEGE